ncbi:MAG: hypothetical protein QXJ28_03005 [Candidatus Pacearchaeota archaeon]
MVHKNLFQKLGFKTIEKVLSKANVNYTPPELQLMRDTNRLIFFNKINHGTYKPIKDEEIDLAIIRKINTEIYNRNKVPQDLLDKVPENTKKSLDAFYKCPDMHPLLVALSADKLNAFRQLLEAGFRLDYIFAYGNRITDYYKGNIEKINEILKELNIPEIIITEDKFEKLYWR